MTGAGSCIFLSRHSRRPRGLHSRSGRPSPVPTEYIRLNALLQKLCRWVVHNSDIEECWQLAEKHFLTGCVDHWYKNEEEHYLNGFEAPSVRLGNLNRRMHPFRSTGVMGTARWEGGPGNRGRPVSVGGCASNAVTSTGGLSVVKKTIEQFVERALRLYGQGPGAASNDSWLRAYVRRWVGWTHAGLGAAATF